MKAKNLSPELQACLRRLFSHSPQPWTVSSILDFGFGEVFIDNAPDPQIGLLRLLHFYFLEGDARSPSWEALISLVSPPATLISRNTHFYDLFRNKHGIMAEPVKRFRYCRDNGSSLPRFLDPGRIPEGIEVRKIGPHEFSQIESNEWSRGVFDAFEDSGDYLSRGFGFCLCCDDRIVSLCTSFTLSHYGAEIEVDTAPSYQRRGFAKIVSAAFIGYCLEKGITPCWDASNEASCLVAESLGFRLEDEYDALRIIGR